MRCIGSGSARISTLFGAITTGPRRPDPLAAGAASTADQGSAVVQRDSESDAAMATGIPAAAVTRLPLYHQALESLLGRDMSTVSSQELADLIGATSAKVRKDLSFLAIPGTRGVGYDVQYLHYRIATELGLTSHRRGCAIVGLGHLGKALANYRGFAERGFTIAALFDADPALIGRRVGPGTGVSVRPVAELEPVLTDLGIRVAVVATPAVAAQTVVDRLVAAGVVSILNFAPCPVVVPVGVQVRQVDLGAELQILAFHEHRAAQTADLDLRPLAAPPGPPASPTAAGNLAQQREAAR